MADFRNSHSVFASLSTMNILSCHAIRCLVVFRMYRCEYEEKQKLKIERCTIQNERGENMEENEY